MTNFSFKLQLADQIYSLFTPKKSRIIETVCTGYTNKYIAQEFDISIKAVEKTLTELNKHFDINGYLYNSRVRMVSLMLAQELCDYSSERHIERVKSLNSNLNQTLSLAAIGLSNKIIAQLMGISIKAVEQRLGQLFDYFGIETKTFDNQNPRVLLVINAYLKQNLTKKHMSKLFNETKKPRLERIVNEPDFFLRNLDCDYNLVG